jgi:hypothetical protein
MVLGAINPINVSVIKDRITTTAENPAKIQTFATQTEQVVDPSKGVSPIVTQKTDIMETLKKYAPYIIGAVVLYYVISKK